jgi:ribose/xylose/arabinose/galactoside ABC-type transport system permease subunit
MCFSLYSFMLACLLVIFISTDTFDLSVNSLMGTIPSQIAMMSNLCESSVVWLLVAMIVLSHVFHCTLLLACHFYFYRYI